MKTLIQYSWVLVIATTAVLAGDPKGEQKPLVQLKCSLKPIPSTAVHHSSKAVPRVRNANGTSENWSGYAVQTDFDSPAADAVSSVTGSWTVPSVSASSTATYSSIWVGIDGYSNGTVEQIGTEHDWVPGKGRKPGGQQNYAWFEMYPDWGYQIVGFPVNAGDSIGAGVSDLGGGEFLLAITNYTKSVYTDVTASLPSQSSAERSSAEWIVEAPWLGGTLPLAHFSTVTFTDCSATLNGHNGSISDSKWQYDAITMQGQQKVRGKTTYFPKATPTGLAGGGTRFSVNWNHE